MSDRIMSLKQNVNGSFGNEIPLGATADNIDVTTSTGVESLQSCLGTLTGGGGSVQTRLSNVETKLSGIESGANKTVVDSSLSSSSTNPVQNKVIQSALNGYLPLSGGTLNGELKLSASGIKEITKNFGYLLGIESFDDGGAVKVAQPSYVTVGNATKANGHTVYSDVPSGAKFTDTNTTYSAGSGIGLSGTSFYNSGVRSISTGGSNGTISVNTNGSSSNVSVKGLTNAAYQSNYIVGMSLGTEWNWIKFTNKTAICFRRKYVNGMQTSAWGNIYTTGTNSIGQVAYPFTFASAPCEVVSLCTGSGTYSGWAIMSQTTNSTTKTASYEIARAGLVTSWVDANISYFVFGVYA